MRVFNRIRKKLLEELKIKAYFFYALGEVVLIVTGVLIALQINDGNEIRKNNLIEHSILESLSEDSQASLVVLDSIIQKSSIRISTLESSMNYTGLGSESLTQAMKDTIFTASSSKIKLVEGTLNSVLNSNKLELIGNANLKRLLTAYPAQVDHLYGVQEELNFITLNRHRPVLEEYLALADRLRSDIQKYDIIRDKGVQSDFTGLLSSKSYQNVLVDLFNMERHLAKEAKDLKSKTRVILDILYQEMNRENDLSKRGKIASVLFSF